MGSVRRPQDLGREVRAFRHGKKWKPRKNPCERPPGQPDHAGSPGPMDFEVRFRVREAKTHLEYYGYAVWNEQTVDSNGLPGEFDVDRYQFQWKVTTDAAGLIYALDAGEKIKGRKTVNVEGDNKLQTIEVTGANAGTFKLEYGGDETAAIAYNATATAVENALEALASLGPADISVSGGPLNTDPIELTFEGEGPNPKVIVSDDDLDGPNPNITVIAKDTYRVYFGHMPRPKRWYVSGRLRVRAGAGCWSDWSTWTTPVHPVDGTTDPLPPFPANTTIDFDHDHSSRHDPLRCVIRGDYVGPWDVPGGDVEDDVARYIVQLQFSNDGGSTWKWPPRRHIVRDRDDNDGKWRAVFHNIDRRKVYRYRVCTEDRYNRRGEWGPGAAHADGRIVGWSAQVDPKTFDDPPPAPTFNGLDVDRDRIEAEIDLYNATWAPRIDYYEWEVYWDSITAPNLKKRDRFHRGLVKRFSLKKNQGHTVIVRCRAYTASDEVSGWASVSGTTATPPIPTIGSTSFDAQGSRHAKYRAIVPVSVNDSGHDDNVVSIRVQLAHKTTVGDPTNATKKYQELVKLNDDPNEAVFRSIPKGHFTFVRAQSIDGQNRESAWGSWIAMGKAKDSGQTATPPNPGTITLVTAADTPRRLVWEWPEPDDDETVRWQVTVKRGGTPVTGYATPKTTRENRHVYRVPKAFQGNTHTIDVVAVSDTGTLSGTTSSGTATPVAETVDGGDIAPGTLGIAAFASGIQPVGIGTSLPSLPNATDWPAGSTFFNTTDDKLYETKTGSSWTEVVTATNMSGQITSGQLAANSVIAGKIQAGAVSATEISVSELSAISADMGTITAGEIYAAYIATDSGSGSRIIIDGTGAGASKDKIQFWSGGSSSALIAANTGIMLGVGTGANLGFWGQTPISKPTAVSGSRGGNVALGQLLSKLHNMGLVTDSSTA